MILWCEIGVLILGLWFEVVILGWGKNIDFIVGDRGGDFGVGI